VAQLPGRDGDAAVAACDRLRTAVEALDGAHRVTISIGLAGCRVGDTQATSYSRADQALYRAKQGGRNRVELLD
jgi:PleD family two-component response regulator